MSFWGMVLTGAVIFAQVCDEDTSPPQPVAPAMAPGSAAPVEFDNAFGDGGIARVSLSPGHDRFMAVTMAPDGTIYGAGYVTVDGDQHMAVARMTPQGALDSSFGTGGVASVNVAPGKIAEVARSIVVQSGKVIISGPVEHDVAAAGDAARDTDIAVVRFDSTGALDGTFGDGGVAVFDLGPGRITSGTTFVGDTSWGMGALAGDRIVIMATALADGLDRTDSDYVIIGLTSSGALDTRFASGGKLVVDLNQSGDNPRAVLVQSDGKVVVTGYSSSGGVVRPVLIRLSSNGVLDASFGDRGVATDTVLPGVAESYSVVRQGGDYVLAGYGRGADPNEKVDMVVYRFHGDGKRDQSFGSDGLTRIDVAGEDDRARNVIVLPDNRLLVAGSGKRTTTDIDGMLVLLDGNGMPVAEFGEGGRLISNLGGPNDSWYALAMTPDDSAIIVTGYMGADATGNDDAVVARIKI